jgi:hypothetical protein
VKTHNVEETVHPTNLRKLTKPAAVLLISRRERFSWKIYNITNTLHSIIYNAGNMLYSRNLRKLAKPAVILISILFIISMVSALSSTSVQGRTTHGNRSWLTPIPTPTSTPAPAPTATPTPTETLTPATGTNLEPLSAFMNSNDVPIMPNGGNYASYDPSVTCNGYPSIQDVGKNPSNPEGEVDGAWIPVSPGDHIEISVWVKTSASTSTDLQSGATLGFNFLGDSNLGEGIIGSTSTDQAGEPTAAELVCGNPTSYGYTISGNNGMTQVGGLISKVPFGASTWTEIQYDFIVPSTYYTYQWINPSGSAPGGVSSITGTQINEMVCWFMVNSNVNNGNVWYADPTLYNLGQTSLP